MALLSRVVRNARAMMRSAEWGSGSVIPPNSATGLGSVGGSVDNVALAVSTVLSCVKALHDDIKSMSFAAYEGDPLGAHQPIESNLAIIEEPFGPDLEPEAGMGQLTVSGAMRGNGYLFVTDTDRRTGLPTQLAILHPDSVQPGRREGRKGFRIGGEWYGPDEVKHVTGVMLPGAVQGIDVVTAQRINIGLAHDVAAYGRGFFANGGAPSGVIEHPGTGDRTKARQVKEDWEAGHSGVTNAHRPGVLFGGAKWVPMSVTPENAQFLATRAFLREEVCGWFSVPLQRIQAITDNASQGGGAGLDAIDAGYVKHGLMPPATSIEQVWRRMIPGGSTWAAFDLDVFLRANALGRAQIAQIHRVTGVRYIDEIRAGEGWAPLPDNQGTDPFTPLNSNTTSPTGGADNAPAPGGQGGTP